MQRIGCQAVTGTVSLVVAESEATLTPLKSRLLKHQLSRTISTPKILDSHAAELVAIDCAGSQILHSVQCGGTGPPITIFSGSQGAL